MIKEQRGLRARANQRFDMPPLEENHHLRNQLISMMLQDRAVLRLISAPHGFGKSSLAAEYAVRLFSGKRVAWVPASNPNFISALDEGRLLGIPANEQPLPELLVLDDVPWLHEERAQALSNHIEHALYQGVEVIATTLPSCDTLRSLQLDRVLIRATDLLVSEQEFLGHIESDNHVERIEAERTWRAANAVALGRVPVCIWEGKTDAQTACLAGFFSERLPLELLNALTAMILLGEGSFDDLAAIGITMRSEDWEMLVDDYAFLDIDTTRLRFSAPKLPLASLQNALTQTDLESILRQGSIPLVERVLARLFDRGRADQGGEVLERFCDDESCMYWLLDRGWDLLDAGEQHLVQALFRRCPEHAVEQQDELHALQAWCEGLGGNWREARYFAERVLEGRVAQGAEDEGMLRARTMAYLALLLFSEGGAAVFSGQKIAAPLTPSSPGGFLTCVVASCSKVELERAFCAGDPLRAEALEHERGNPSERQVKLLENLFTAGEHRFDGSPFYLLSLHILQYIDDLRLHKLLQTLGRDVIIGARRNGLSRYSEAVLVRDLWMNGYFGIVGPSADNRDARLLDDAARVLRSMGKLARFNNVDIPWELGRPRVSIEPTHEDRVYVKDDVPILNVKMFGSFEVMTEHRYIQETEWRRKSRLLFIILALHQGRDVVRNELLDQLWPGRARGRALDNFYTVWSNVHAALGNECYLERNGEFCRINPRYVQSDVAEFEQHARCLLTEHPDANTLLDIYARMESLYRGGLVPSEQSNEFIISQRERLSAMFTDAMVAAVEIALDIHDARIALWFARKALEEEPHREDVYFALIRAQIAAGQRCSAIRTYFDCREYLRSELGLDPSRETQQLYDKLITVDPSLLKLDPSSFRH